LDLRHQLQQIYRQPTGQTGSEFLAERGGFTGTGPKDAADVMVETAEKVKRSWAGIGRTVAGELLTVEEAQNRVKLAANAYGFELKHVQSVVTFKICL